MKLGYVRFDRVSYEGDRKEKAHYDESLTPSGWPILCYAVQWGYVGV